MRHPLCFTIKALGLLWGWGIGMQPCAGQSQKFQIRDLYSDTWVGSDALGRTMPTSHEVGLPKTDPARTVGIFYITWHTQDRAAGQPPYEHEVTRILEQDSSARLHGDHPLWSGHEYHWGEPEVGYYLSLDEWVFRRDLSMLSDAGVDVLILDVTNAQFYWKEWEMMFRTMQQMKAQGNRVPQFCFWAFNGPSITVAQTLYDSIYKENRYRDLWFMWDEKPLLCYNATPWQDSQRESLIQHPNPHYRPAAATDPTDPNYGDPDYCEPFYKDYTREVVRFFTLRNLWSGDYQWKGERYLGTEDHWSFYLDMADPRVQQMTPKERLSTHQGRPEQGVVSAAQHPVSHPRGVGKSWSLRDGEPQTDAQDLPIRAYVPWLGDTVDHPSGYGIYFQERWNEMLQADPPFLLLVDWNEWTAGKWTPATLFEHGEPGATFPFLGRDNDFFFVDQYNSEFNRALAPMKGGYTDNYYMQMAQNIRRYKGARPIPSLDQIQEIALDAPWSAWDSVTVEYRDTYGDITHRDAPGYQGLHYTNQSGRNDLLTAKVAVGAQNLRFYMETADTLTPHTDPNWMLLLLDTDADPTTGWYGYDYALNLHV
ncbi:MAG: hypothetical protein PHV49_06250, partial [Alistipes sp.]|nr:hypothetical protein [Alistipes sp.]